MAKLNKKSSRSTPLPTSSKPKENTGEVDSLDAFMASLEKGIKKKKKPRRRTDRRKVMKLEERLGSEATYVAEDQFQTRNLKSGGYTTDQDVYKAAKEADRRSQTEKNLQYDTKGNIVHQKDRIIKSLEPIDYSKVFYRKVKKDIYKEHPEIFSMDDSQCHSIRVHMSVTVDGSNVPSIASSFGHFEYNFSKRLMKNIQISGFQKPTGIQAQGVPCILSGRDVMGIAKTGSGKTAAFLWPLICSIEEQGSVERGEGPIGVIVAPTRELADQIYKECLKFTKGINGIRCCPLYGGMTMYEQKLALEKGVEIIVCTPGRMIDMIRKQHTNCFRTTYLVLDEADRMFSLGFETQIRSIINQCRPDKQLLMFSATMNKKVSQLATDSLVNPVRIEIGGAGVANKDIRQITHVVNTEEDKGKWILASLRGWLNTGRLLIFCSTKHSVEKLHSLIKQAQHNYHPTLMHVDVKVGFIHGDKGQLARQAIVNEFKRKIINVLVATDVAARGLDIKGLKTVVNYDRAHSIDAHIHRVGRTGRAGEKGVAYTLLCRAIKGDKKFSKHLIKSLKKSKQEVSDQLLEFAGMTSKALASLMKKPNRGGWKQGKKGKKGGIGFQGGFSGMNSLQNSFQNRFRSSTGAAPGLKPGEMAMSFETMKKIRVQKNTRWGPKS